jgi:hypothetical protein
MVWVVKLRCSRPILTGVRVFQPWLHGMGNAMPLMTDCCTPLLHREIDVVLADYRHATFRGLQGTRRSILSTTHYLKNVLQAQGGQSSKLSSQGRLSPTLPTPVPWRVTCPPRVYVSCQVPLPPILPAQHLGIYIVSRSSTLSECGHRQLLD